MKVLLDTGSDATLLSSYCYKKLHPNWNGGNQGQVSSLKAVGNAMIPICGVRRVKLSFGRVTVSHKVVILYDPTGVFTMFVGKDILYQYGSIISIPDQAILFTSGKLADVQICWGDPNGSLSPVDRAAAVPVQPGRHAVHVNKQAFGPPTKSSHDNRRQGHQSIASNFVFAMGSGPLSSTGRYRYGCAVPWMVDSGNHGGQSFNGLTRVVWNSKRKF